MKNKEKKNVRFARLEVAVATCLSEGGSDEDFVARQRIMNGLCKADPVVKEVLKTYGVDVE